MRHMRIKTELSGPEVVKVGIAVVRDDPRFEVTFETKDSAEYSFVLDADRLRDLGELVEDFLRNAASAGDKASD